MNPSHWNHHDKNMAGRAGQESAGSYSTQLLSLDDGPNDMTAFENGEGRTVMNT